MIGTSAPDGRWTAITRRLASTGQLRAGDKEAVESLQTSRMRQGAGTVLGRGRQSAYGVVSGWLACTQRLSDGRRQVLGFVLPGDTINVARRSVPLPCCRIECLTDVELADLQALRDHLAAALPEDAIGMAVRELMEMDDAWRMSEIARLIRQSAFERVACLFLDMWQRLHAVDLVVDNAFEIPLSHVAIAESVGLSGVHVKRIMIRLREAGLLEFGHGRIELPDPPLLARRAHYCAAAHCATGLGECCACRLA